MRNFKIYSGDSGLGEHIDKLFICEKYIYDIKKFLIQKMFCF